MILYVSGPMTGLPDHNYPAFDRVAARLTEAGYEVLNPARHGPDAPDATWTDFMRLALIDLAAADGICLLPRAAGSRGAQLELHIARELGLPVHDLLTWQAQATEPGRVSA